MDIKGQVPFKQLLTIVKTLTPAQKARLRQELDEEKPISDSQDDDFIKFLLNGPVYNDQEIAVIEENRNSIAAWRTKS